MSTAVHASVGGYELVTELGNSYLGSCWLAAAPQDGTIGPAVLARNIEFARDLPQSARALVSTAARALLQLESEELPRTIDVVVEDERITLISDYLEGESIDTILTLLDNIQTYVDVHVAVRILLDTLEQLEHSYADCAKLGPRGQHVHGGLSPYSVIVDTSGSTHLFDLLVGSTASRHPGFGHAPTKAAYAAPEQLTRLPRADARSDVFAAGILAWELMASRRLFVGPKQGVIDKVHNLPIPRLDVVSASVHPELADVIEKALQRNPAQRYKRPSEFAAALREACPMIAGPHEVAQTLTELAEQRLAERREQVRTIQRRRDEPSSQVRKNPHLRALAAQQHVEQALDEPGDGTTLMDPEQPFATPGAQGSVSEEWEAQDEEPTLQNDIATLSQAAEMLRSDPKPALGTLDTPKKRIPQATMVGIGRLPSRPPRATGGAARPAVNITNPLAATMLAPGGPPPVAPGLEPTEGSPAGPPPLPAHGASPEPPEADNKLPSDMPPLPKRAAWRDRLSLPNIGRSIGPVESVPPAQAAMNATTAILAASALTLAVLAVILAVKVLS